MFFQALLLDLLIQSIKSLQSKGLRLVNEIAELETDKANLTAEVEQLRAEKVALQTDCTELEQQRQTDAAVLAQLSCIVGGKAFHGDIPVFELTINDRFEPWKPANQSRPVEVRSSAQTLHIEPAAVTVEKLVAKLREPCNGGYLINSSLPESGKPPRWLPGGGNGRSLIDRPHG